MIILSRFVIQGHSMEPTIKENQTVIVSAIPYLLRTPKINEVVALKSPIDEKILIKRITKMNHKTYFVAGDNQSDSTDSRKFGMIGRDQILGKVIAY